MAIHGMGPVPSAVLNLTSTYLARRALWRIIVSRALAKHALTFEQSDLLFELSDLRQFAPSASARDPKGYVHLKQLEAALVNSQPYVSRRVKELEKRGFLVGAKGAKTGLLSKSLKVRLTDAGQQTLKLIADDYSLIAEGILAATSEKKRLSHFRVCQEICRRIKPPEFLGIATPKEAPPAVQNIMMIFEVARSLRKPIQERTLVGTGLTIEKADLLVILYLENPVFASQRATEQTEGFVPLANLSESLVHSISPSKFLVSRWLSEVLKKKQVETRALDSKRKEARITSDGIRLVEPIWRNYVQLAQELLDGIPDAERDAHREVNQSVSLALRPVWLKGLILGAT